MTIQALLACLFPILVAADPPVAPPPPDPYAGRREMTQAQIKYWEDPALAYQVLDREELKAYQLDGVIDIEVRPIGPLGTRKWAYIVGVSPRDTSDIPRSAELVVWASTPGDTTQASRAPHERFHAVERTRLDPMHRGDRFEYRFELEAARAPTSTLDLVLRRDQVSLVLRGFPALAPE